MIGSCWRWDPTSVLLIGRRLYSCRTKPRKLQTEEQRGMSGRESHVIDDACLASDACGTCGAPEHGDWLRLLIPDMIHVYSCWYLQISFSPYLAR